MQARGLHPQPGQARGTDQLISKPPSEVTWQQIRPEATLLALLQVELLSDRLNSRTIEHSHPHPTAPKFAYSNLVLLQALRRARAVCRRS